jgi:alpha-L-fucosidase
MLEIFYASIGRGANLLVNLTPDPTGRVPAAEVAMLEAAGQAIAAPFGQPVAQMTGDGNWEEGHTLRLAFERPTRVAQVAMEEDLRHGQRVRGYRVEALVDGHWQTVANGQSIGRKRVERFDPRETTAIRLRILECDPLPHIRLLAAYGPQIQ